MRDVPAESAEDLYEHAPCGYLSALPDGTIVRVNATFLEWTGFASDDLVGKRHFQDLLTAGGKIYHETHYAPLLRMQGSVREIALDIVCADGTRMPVLVNSRVRLDGDGRPDVVRTAVFGATERKSYERELVALRRREQEARERVEELYEQVRDVARVLQSQMLPAELPSDDRYELASYYESAVERLDVGGDWYDAFALGDDRVAISIGDVVGRGLEAAATMGQLRSSVRALASAGLPPVSVLERTNVFFEHAGAAFGATAIYGYVDLGTGLMRFASAGHLPPVLVRPGGEALLLEGGRSVPLGAAFAESDRIEEELVLEPGSRILLYTDGLVERRGHPLDEDLLSFVREFGTRAELPLERAVGELVAAAPAAAAEADDKCMLAFAYRP